MPRGVLRRGMLVNIGPANIPSAQKLTHKNNPIERVPGLSTRPPGSGLRTGHRLRLGNGKIDRRRNSRPKPSGAQSLAREQSQYLQLFPR